jgi:hypothetical protein
MPDDVFDELVGDMKRRGFRPQFPIIVHNGKIIDGVNRARASVKAGVEPVYQQFDGKDEDVDRFIIQANLCRRHLKPEEKRALLKKLLKVSPKQSDRTIATMANVSPTTVGSVRRELGSNVQVGHKDRVEKSGRKARGRKPGSGKPKSTTAKGPSVHPSARGVEVPTPSEKLTSDLPKGSAEVENSNKQVAVAETRTQPAATPNPIKAAWLAADNEQRLEFVKDHGHAVADWLADSTVAEWRADNCPEDQPTKCRIWQSCGMIEASLDELEDDTREELSSEYASLASQLSELEDRIDDELAEDEEDEVEEPEEVA